MRVEEGRGGAAADDLGMQVIGDLRDDLAQGGLVDTWDRHMCEAAHEHQDAAHEQDPPPDVWRTERIDERLDHRLVRRWIGRS